MDKLSDADVDRLIDGGASADNASSKKKDEPPPESTNDVIVSLAGLTPLQYAQRLSREAKKYRTQVKLLEKAVEAVKIEKEADQSLEPH
jgi:hypothetical protein